VSARRSVSSAFWQRVLAIETWLLRMARMASSCSVEVNHTDSRPKRWNLSRMRNQEFFTPP
jgi:hypothetical protein